MSVGSHARGRRAYDSSPGGMSAGATGAKSHSALPPVARKNVGFKSETEGGGIRQASPISGQMKLNPISRKGSGNLGDGFAFKSKQPASKHISSKSSVASSRAKFEGGAPEMKKLEELRSDDPTHIYCIGDNKAVLKFEIGYMNWFRTPVSNDKKTVEGFDGSLRYSAAAFCPCAEPKILYTGGCYVINGFPSSNVCEFSVKQIHMPKKKRPMLLKRYGHLSVYLNGLVYAIGGFSHKDLPHEQPVTLSACEKFSVTAENQWTHVSQLCEPRAFASQVTFNGQYIYVFGGMNDYTVLQSIEKYDTLNDNWVKMYFKLPKPIAKLGSCLLNDSTIFIAGGMSKDFEPTADCWQLDLKSLQWTEKMSLFAPRLTSSGLIFSQGEYPYVYAIGGNKSR